MNIFSFSNCHSSFDLNFQIATRNNLKNNILFTFAHVLHMRKRKVLSDNEWTGWLRRMKSAFNQGTIRDIWKSKIEMEKWFDPASNNSLTRN